MNKLVATPISNMTSTLLELTGLTISHSTTEIEVPVPAAAAIPAPKKRKNVDFNICELVDAILIAFHCKLLAPMAPAPATPTNANTIRTLCQEWLDAISVPSCIRLNDFTDLSKYMTDFTSKTACVSKRIVEFEKVVVTTPAFKFTDILCIYISGKKNAHPKIQTLNAGLDIKQQKGDIYIEYATGEIAGWSCKQSSNATKSNYSVQKILGAEISKKLKKTKSEFLAANGFATFSKEQRDSVNQLFYPKNKVNPYWDTMRDEIAKNKASIITELVKGLTGYTIPYPLYEFDGTSFQSLNAAVSVNDDTHSDVTPLPTLEEHADYYMMKNGEERSAAKMFYQLCVMGKKYRVEIRWKGNVHGASPQFQIHDDHAAIHDQDHDQDHDHSQISSQEQDE